MGRLLKTKVNLNILNINKQFDWIQRLNLQIVNIHILHGLEYLYYILSVAFPYLLPPRESLHCSPGIGGRKLESCSADVTTVCSVSTGVSALYPRASPPMRVGVLMQPLTTFGIIGVKPPCACRPDFRNVVCLIQALSTKLQSHASTSIILCTFHNGKETLLFSDGDVLECTTYMEYPDF